MEDLNTKLQSVLLKADKPSRYVGGEFNTPPLKDGADLNFLLCFPDVYEVAFSNLGIKILYSILNNRKDTCCQTAYAVWHDMAMLMRQNNIPLFSLEQKKPAKEFDIIGFSLQYEMSYTNVLYMLELADIPLYHKERSENDPLIIGGGPCAINPMPVADFFDLFCIGDGEDVIEKLADEFIANKKAGGTKADFLKKASNIQGIYIPSLNQKSVKRAVVRNLDKAFYPTKVQIPNTEAVHNRAVLEIFRGCTRGCRFCQAGMIYRPVRERNVDTLVKYAQELIVNCGYDEISFSSLSTCDYPHLHELLQKIKPITDAKKVNISLPSTRLDSFEADFVTSSRKSSITFAPEAGTQRLRDVINKNITEEDIISSLRVAFERGYSSVKLYFMLGLPTETQDDIDGIVELGLKIKKLYKESSTQKRPLNLSVSTSTFIPKPFTPFQWEKHLSFDEVIKAQNYLKDRFKRIGIKYSWHDAKVSQIETVFSRGGKETSKAIYLAYKSGCIFDGWSEFFDYSKWVDAINKSGLKIETYTNAQDTLKPLAWDIIDAGVTKKYLLSERKRAYEQKCTPDCRNKCLGCGINHLTDCPNLKSQGGVKDDSM